MEHKSLTRVEIIEFLRHVLELEGNIYTAIQMMNQLRDRAERLGKHNEHIPEIMTYTSRDASNSTKEIIKIIVSALGSWFVGVCIIILCQMVISDTLIETPINVYTLIILIGSIVYIYIVINEKNKEIEKA